MVILAAISMMVYRYVQRLRRIQLKNYIVYPEDMNQEPSPVTENNIRHNRRILESRKTWACTDQGDPERIRESMMIIYDNRIKNLIETATTANDIIRSNMHTPGEKIFINDSVYFKVKAIGQCHDERPYCDSVAIKSHNTWVYHLSLRTRQQDSQKEFWCGYQLKSVYQ